jgi:hypothetical protein
MGSTLYQKWPTLPQALSNTQGEVGATDRFNTRFGQVKIRPEKQFGHAFLRTACC